MSLDIKVLIIIAASTFIISLIRYGFKKRKKNLRSLKTKAFTTNWRQLQKYCRNKDNWPFALLEADKLLDKALKKQRYKGKTMGARLMSAQREITDNDSIWVAHNLAKKIQDAIKNETEIKLSKAQMKDTLTSFQNALLDLGALKRANNEASDD
jgi:hypothetical protein